MKSTANNFDSDLSYVLQRLGTQSVKPDHLSSSRKVKEDLAEALVFIVYSLLNLQP